MPNFLQQATSRATAGVFVRTRSRRRSVKTTANGDWEAELKPECPPATLEAAGAPPVVGEFINGPVKRETLTSLYFATRKLQLLRAGLALRLRHNGSRRVQTIKAIRKGGRSLLGRAEWEEEVKTDTPDLT